MKPILFFLLAVSASAQSRSITNIVHTPGSYLGVGIAEITSERAKELKLNEERGVEIKFIAENSPASKAGLKTEDVVLELNGQRVEGISQFTRFISEIPPGRKANLSILRGGTRLNLVVLIEARANVQMPFPPFPTMPPMPPMPSINMPDLPRAAIFMRNGKLGIETEPLNTQLAEYFGVKEGILVRSVTRQSPAEKAGIKAGDVIVKADGKPVAITRDVTSLLPNRKSITLGIVRNRKDVTLEVTLDGF